MLRALVVALLVANLGFLAWTGGWLDGLVGVRSTGDREPERLERQLRPDAVRVLPAETPASAAVGAADSDSGSGSSARSGAGVDAGPAGGASGAAAASVATAAPHCLEAGPFTETGLAAARSALQAMLPGGGWVAVRTELPGSWAVYLGPYPSIDALARKKSELDRRQVAYQETAPGTALAGGLTLGRFGDRAAADQALERFAEQDVRTARVVELAAPRTRQLLRVEAADAGLAARLTALRLEPLGRGFVPCPSAAPAL